MSFLQQVRDEVLQYAESEVSPDVPQLLPMFTELLELGATTTKPDEVRAWVKTSRQQWLASGRLVALAEQLARRVRASWPSKLDAERAHFVRIAASLILQYALRVDAGPMFGEGAYLTEGRRAMLRQIGFEALEATSTFGWNEHANLYPFEYIQEVGLIAPSGVTAVGRAFLRLHGRDAVRWLIAVELARSTGYQDEWRCSRDTAAWILEHPNEKFDALDESDGPPFSWRTVERLAALGVASEVEDGGMYGYNLTDLGLDILRELTVADPPPLLSLAKSLSADVTAEALRELGPLGRQASAETVEQAIAEQTRNLVHELRNKLSPLQTAMGVLVQAVPAGSRTGTTGTAIAMAGRVIDELFRFAAATEELSSGLRPPPEWFNLGKALQEAAASGRNGRHDAHIVVDPAVEQVQLHGPRLMFVTAIANLVRNAIQAMPDTAPEITIGLTVAEGETRLDVDDNGPGVKPELRERIFDSGFSTRPGGTGQGLDLVRSTIERDFGGNLKYLQSPAGGARFRLILDAGRVRRVAPSVPDAGGLQ